MVRRSEIEQEGSLGETRTPKQPKQLVSANDFDFWYDITRRVERMPKARSMAEIIEMGRFIESRVRRWIEGYQANERYRGEAFSVFRSEWKIVRSWVPLQVRLAVEQICYDKGYPWRRLYTGFNPL